MKFKIPRDHILYTQYFQENGLIPTHILLKKEYAEINKRWILFSVNLDGSLEKICVGSNPQELESHIKYMKDTKECCI